MKGVPPISIYCNSAFWKDEYSTFSHEWYFTEGFNVSSELCSPALNQEARDIDTLCS
jgi:hypothetical protein